MALSKLPRGDRRTTSLPGIGAFVQSFPVHKTLLVGENGIPVEEFLLSPVAEWF